MPGRPLLTDDAWLSSVMGTRTVRVDCAGPALSPAQQGELAGLRGSPGVFAYAKVAPDAIATAEGLQRAGFFLVDTNISLSRDAAAPPAQPAPEFTVRFLAPSAPAELRLEVGNVAAESFQFTRFHLDPFVEKAMANKIKRAWAENFFSGQRGDFLAVAEDRQGKVAGFLLALKAPGRAVIDLIATHPRSQGNGAGRALVAALEKECGPGIDVGTQLANQSSLLFYQRLGFRVTGGKYIFHFHSPKASA